MTKFIAGFLFIAFIIQLHLQFINIKPIQSMNNMNNTYADLVDQTFNFPQHDFKVEDEYLQYNGLDIKSLIDKYGTPLKLTYLPKIGMQIKKAKDMFASAFKKHKYEGKYNYCYCTKSSHFSFIVEEALKNDIHLETSYAYDIEIVNKLYEKKKISKDTYIICNGYKQKSYTSRIARLLNSGFKNVIPILDNKEELKAYKSVKSPFKVGIRVAAEEEPNFPFYTSRLGMRAKDILEFYVDEIEGFEHKFQLKMLHIFLNKGIKDDIYYWSELNKVINLYCQLKKICPNWIPSILAVVFLSSIPWF
jgi:arginine decarboxylase